MNKMNLLNELKCIPHQDPIFSQIAQIVSHKREHNKFRFDFRNDVFFNCYGRIDMSQKIKMKILIYQLINHPEGASKDTLLKEIYGACDSRNLSKRHQSCLEHNIIKLISRARRELTKGFREYPARIKWIPFDPYTKKWKLFEIRYNLSNHSRANKDRTFFLNMT